MRTLIAILALPAILLSSCGECGLDPKPTSSGAPAGAPADSSHAYITLTSANFQSEVLDSKQPVLVDFWASWCAPCRAIAPAVEELATDYAGRAKVGKLDVDADGKLAQEYGISAIPALLIFKDGKVVERLVGLQEKKDLAAALDSALK